MSFEKLNEQMREMTFLGPDLQDGDIVTDVIMVARIKRLDDDMNSDRSALVPLVTRGTDSVVQRGILESVLDLLRRA